MRIGLPLLAIAAVFACSQESDVTAPEPQVTTATAAGTEHPIFPAPESLIGEYRVAGIDGEPVEQSYGIALSITDSEISYEPKCAGFVWTYTYAADGTLSTERHPDYGGEAQPDGSVVVCAVGLKPNDIPLAQAIDATTRVERTPENAILLSGGGRSVTLFSQ